MLVDSLLPTILCLFFNRNKLVASFVEVTTHLFTAKNRNSVESAECELLHGFINVLSLSVDFSWFRC